MKARQSSKIRELAEAVESAGFLTLDEQAKGVGSSPKHCLDDTQG